MRGAGAWEEAWLARVLSSAPTRSPTHRLITCLGLRILTQVTCRRFSPSSLPMGQWAGLKAPALRSRGLSADQPHPEAI